MPARGQPYLKRLALVCSGVAMLWLAQRAAAQAQPHPERPLAEVVQVHPGATCLAADRLISRVARWRERESVDARIQVSVEGDAKVPTRVSFVVKEASGAHAERSLEDAPTDCDQLHAAVALSIALAIDATLLEADAKGAQAAPPPPPPIKESPPAPPLRPLPAEQPAPKPEVVERAVLPVRHARHAATNGEPLHLDVGLFGGANTGLLSAAALGLGTRISLSPAPWLSLAVVGLGTGVGEQTIASAPGLFDAQLIVGGLDACFLGQAIDGLELQGCVGARGGQMRTIGHSFPVASRVAPAAWWAFNGSGQARLWLTRWVAIGLSLELLVPTAEQVILVRGLNGARDRSLVLPRVGLSAGLGPVFRLF